MDVWEIAALSPEPGRPEVLRSDDGAARVIALALHENEFLSDHQVHEHAWVSVLDGTLEVSSGSDRREVGRGSLIHFAPGERHEVRAKTYTRILLLLAPWPGAGHPSLRS
jgi:quercetin dioxygenase-like cupin family protein